MPRAPITLTEAQKAEVETLAALLSQEQIADYLGICRTTFRAICDRDPEVAERYKKGKARAIAHVAKGLLMKARDGDTTSSIFYLKTQGGWRETERIEHSGPGGRPLLSAMDDDQLYRELGRVVSDLAGAGVLPPEFGRLLDGVAEEVAP